MRVLKIGFDGVKLFKDSHFEIDFLAKDRVVNHEDVYAIDAPIYTQKIISLAGINASGKTIVLKLILMAMNLLSSKKNLFDEISNLDIFCERVVITIVFYLDGYYYKLVSEIEIVQQDKDSFDNWGTDIGYRFAEEYIWSKKASATTKKNIFDFESSNHLIRSELPKAVKDFLSDSTSVIHSVARDNSPVVAQMIGGITQHDVLNFFGTTPPEIVQVFDSSVEYLRADSDSDGDTLYLKFKNESDDTPIKSTQLHQVLSSGTIKGDNLCTRMIHVLRGGGYLLLDEIENHFNKKLVEVIVEIFSSAKYNPNGATLIFTTHYPELLDLLRRKDNLYFLVRNENFRIDIVNYSNRVKRIENKKSEVFISNYVKGTAPKYEEVRGFKDFIADCLGT